ncbi:MAG: bifunctional adenosylcobinamide kinase/adenosylcobinamide-phosphate guanylyltransferase [Spirochaetaceae bacterium]|nr:bifunctional adenosylcobinamide kinase/adenosylcobinamide-phosphate guanylyltransferase [Spirochaetaceae bacterium]
MILIIGGVKSGKSSWASSLASERETLGPVSYLATARAGDDEMKDRISRHQADRPSSWTTVEEPDNPADYFLKMTSDALLGTTPSTVLFDCITLWLTNILAPFGDEPNREEALVLGEKEGRHLMAAVLGWEKTAPPGTRETLIVSNYVEAGLISPWPLGRIFQDIAGLTHQMFAAEASQVYLMTAGIPQKLK